MSNNQDEIQKLNLPEFSPKLKNDFGIISIWDALRKKYIKLTPEEWVRQHFVNYLLTYKQYPAGRIGNEITLIFNGMKKRCDTVVYDDFGQPLVIVEYKAPTVAITQQVFNQISVYNMAMRVPLLIVSNGMSHYCCRMNYEENTYLFLEDIPIYIQAKDEK